MEKQTVAHSGFSLEKHKRRHRRNRQLAEYDLVMDSVKPSFLTKSISSCNTISYQRDLGPSIPKTEVAVAIKIFYRAGLSSSNR